MRNGLLATLDVSGLTESDRFDFRLTVENGTGTHVKRRSGISIDPTLRHGWPQSIGPVADAEYLTVTDLDGDGLKEVIWVDPGTARVFVWKVEGTPGPLVADWPMYHHDPKHTNTFLATP